MGLHRFYHADRGRTLATGQTLTRDGNDLSRFGAAYWPALSGKAQEDMTDAEVRETMIERARRSDIRFATFRPSRFQVLFGALTISDAIIHAQTIDPPFEGQIPIFEIWSDNFITLDRNWLDYDGGGSPEHLLEHYRSYWWGEVSNHNPEAGARRAPLLEVLISLPATVGEIVAQTAQPDTGFIDAENI